MSCLGIRTESCLVIGSTRSHRERTSGRGCPRGSTGHDSTAVHAECCCEPAAAGAGSSGPYLGGQGLGRGVVVDPVAGDGASALPDLLHQLLQHRALLGIDSLLLGQPHAQLGQLALRVLVGSAHLRRRTRHGSDTGSCRTTSRCQPRDLRVSEAMPFAHPCREDLSSKIGVERSGRGTGQRGGGNGRREGRDARSFSAGGRSSATACCTSDMSCDCSSRKAASSLSWLWICCKSSAVAGGGPFLATGRGEPPSCAICSVLCSICAACSVSCAVFSALLSLASWEIAPK